jgi:hypothetical protein
VNPAIGLLLTGWLFTAQGGPGLPALSEAQGKAGTYAENGTPQIASPAVTATQARPQGEKATPPPSEPQYPTINVGTLTYLQYDAEMKNRDGYNAFDVTRGYINITGDLMKNVRFRITPDVKRATDGSSAGSLILRLKYGYAEFDNVGAKGSWLRFGLHQTPWIDFEEGINRYRVQGTMFTEREGIIPGSADFGAGYFTPLPGKYGEIQVGVYNGEGYTQTEANKYKSFQGRLTIRPFPNARVIRGLRFSGFHELGWYAAGHPRRHAVVMASFEHTNVVATAEWLSATESPTPPPGNVDQQRRGYSTFLEVRQGLEGLAGFFRYDHFNPNTALTDNHDRRTIAGIAYWLKDQKVRIGLVFNDEDVRYGATRAKPDENRLLAQAHVQF